MNVKLLLLKGKDLPKGIFNYGLIAVDCEFMGLNFQRDRLCLVQLFQKSTETLVIMKMPRLIRPSDFENLRKIIEDPRYVKVMHYAVGDLTVLSNALRVSPSSIRCTRTMSRIVRTFTDNHGLASLTKEIVGIRLNKSLSCTY